MKFFLLFSAAIALVAAAPAEEIERATCPCEQVYCIQSFPDSCYCERAAAEKCYESCGGEKPVYTESCEGGTLPGVADPTTPAKYVKCGSRGLAPCAEGTICVDDPTFSKRCGQDCDLGGYCVPDEPCLAGLADLCPQEGSVCADDPRDDCINCRGICFNAANIPGPA